MSNHLRTIVYLTLLSLAVFTVGCERESSDTQAPKQATTQSPASGANKTPEDQSAPAAKPGKAGRNSEETEEQKTREFDDEFAGHAATKNELRPEALWAPDTTDEYPIGAYKNYIEKGDLDALKKRGKLRILVDGANTDSLHRAATQQDVEIELAKHKADLLGLQPVVLYADNFDQLIPLLREGKGDVIANALVPTPERRQLIDFSIPVGKTHNTLISRKDVPDVKKGDKLNGKTLAVTKGTVFEDEARAFVQQHPGMKLKMVDRNYAELALDVSLGHIDFTIIDEQIFDLISQFRENLKKNIVFPREDHLTIGFRKDSPQLEKALNSAIRQVKLTNPYTRSIGDLDKIKERGVLRAVTRNHPGTYFMWKGRIMGYEYELLKGFAKKLGVRLEILVAPTHADLFRMIRDGKADVGASLLSITKFRDEHGMDFGPPYMEEKVEIVGGTDDHIDSLDDLEGRTIHVLKSSSQYEVLMDILKDNPDLKLKVEFVPEELTIPEILDRVADGDYDLTIADDITVRLEHHWRNDIVALYDLRVEENAYGWMVRGSNPKLLQAVNNFFNDKKNTKLREQLFHKYFDEPKRTRKEIRKLSKKGEISPFDKLVKKYAEQYDFDWRLVVAQMFQESTFNPKAKSWVGARGLMQVMPDTGRQVGESNLFHPENSVRAGLKYLEWLHRKFEDKGISPENMMWFTLASYNAGLGHVYDAQDLAEEKGWDRNVWFGNVENAMLLLAEKKYYSKARYGYARGREPYDYVRKITARYRTYVALLKAYKRQHEVGALTCGFAAPWLAGSWPDCTKESPGSLAGSYAY